MSATDPGPTPGPGHRLRQGIGALGARAPRDRDAILAAILTPAQAEAFQQLPPHDQAHLCRTYRLLRRQGVVDSDLLRAGLLHDIGKACNCGGVQISHRVARVWLGRAAPGLLRWLAREPAAGWRVGLVLAVHHPRLGAERAQMLGCSERVCWLIAHHADTANPDPDLARLRWADQAAG